MTLRRYCLQLAALAAALPLAMGQTQPSQPAASQPAATSAAATGPTRMERLTEFVRQMSTAADLGALGEYVSQAREIDRNNPAVHHAHMKRALQLGRPLVAMAPALELTRLHDNWPGAWSVIGYCHARHDKMLLALVALFKAMELPGDDPSVLNNAAICLAWYEDQQPRPRISGLLKISIDNNKPAWMAKPAFSQSYAAAAGALALRRTTMTDLEHQAENAHSAYYQAKNAIAAVVETHNKAVREIDNQRRALEQLEKSAAAASQPANTPQAPAGKKQPTSAPRPGQANRDKIAELEKLNQQRVQQVAELSAEARAQRQKGAELRQTLYKVEHSQPTFAWMPPAVDGKAVEDRERMPTTRRSRSQTQDSALPVDDGDGESISPDVKVRLAEMLLRNGMRKKAAEALSEVVAEHPGTPAAVKAQQLITQHKLQ